MCVSTYSNLVHEDTVCCRFDVSDQTVLVSLTTKTTRDLRTTAQTFFKISTFMFLWRKQAIQSWTDLWVINNDGLSYFGWINPLMHKVWKPLLMHNMGLKWPVFISYVISYFDGHFFCFIFWNQFISAFNIPWSINSMIYEYSKYLLTMTTN